MERSSYSKVADSKFLGPTGGRTKSDWKILRIETKSIEELWGVEGDPVVFFSQFSYFSNLS